MSAAASTVTTGVTGSAWRASITPWGDVEPWDGAPLRWFVAAEDRWHVPADEPAVRQRRIDGTPVTETRVRVPNGDVVQRIASVPDAGGLTVIEVENESTAAVAIAFDRRDVLTERPVGDVPIEGIDLPAGAFVVPVAHTATVRIGIPHTPAAGRDGGGALPTGLPPAVQVARGWTTITDRASRFVLPDGPRGGSLAIAITAARCELALGGVAHAVDDPISFAIGLGELVRMGERPDPWLPELVEAVALLGPLPGWAADVALRAADRVLLAASEDRARRDLARIVAGRPPSARPADPPGGIADVAWLESRFATDGELLPDGLPAEWLGQPVEVYGVPTTGRSTVSFAMRWHGPRPAVLWEQAGEPVELTAPVVAPGWHTGERQGEALWPTPPGADAAMIPPSDDEPIAPARPSPVVRPADDDEPGSFT